MLRAGLSVTWTERNADDNRIMKVIVRPANCRDDVIQHRPFAVTAFLSNFEIPERDDLGQSRNVVEHSVFHVDVKFGILVRVANVIVDVPFAGCSISEILKNFTVVPVVFPIIPVAFIKMDGSPAICKSLGLVLDLSANQKKVQITRNENIVEGVVVDLIL